VAGPLDIAGRLDEAIAEAPRHPGFIRRLALTAVELRPPTGFLRDLVVEHRGAHAGTFAVKDSGITPITNLARAYAVSVGATGNRTLARLGVAVASGRIDEELGAGLREAFRLLWRVRLEHHARRIGEGGQPDDHVDPAEIGPVARRGLKEAFRTIERAQRLLAREMGFRLR
jgi:CBS domain-containing protein